MSIQTNLSDIRSRLPKGCKLIAVSKTHSVERILEAYQAGQRLFGENKVQELAAKAEQLPADIQWHMIGHLQTNKVKYIAPFVSMIHSVDSLKVLKEINRQAARVKRTLSCLIQVHIAQEEDKFGFSREEVLNLMTAPDWQHLEQVRIAGLMGMATFTEDTEQVRGEFRSLKHLFDELSEMSLPRQVSMTELSMGMSSDYPIAIEEGSTLVRIGTVIFGTRDYT